MLPPFPSSMIHGGSYGIFTNFSPSNDISTNSQAGANDSWLIRCSPQALGYGQSNSSDFFEDLTLFFTFFYRFVKFSNFVLTIKFKTKEQMVFNMAIVIVL